MYNPKLKEIMTLNPFTVGPDDSMARVDELFNTHNFHHLPVVNKENEVVGMISKSDYRLLCGRLTLFMRDRERTENLAYFRSLLVEEVMTTPVAKLGEENEASIAVGFFRENLFHAVPVVNKDNKLVGILTPLDLINYAFNEMNTIY
ncbi:MAG: CBS domain-containing protein [Bacteroidota bacterium]